MSFLVIRDHHNDNVQKQFCTRQATGTHDNNAKTVIRADIVKFKAFPVTTIYLHSTRVIAIVIQLTLLNSIGATDCLVIV